MRAWLYYRLSRDEDQEMNSLHNQRQIIVDYAEQHGYEIVGESFDDNVTGMTFAREGIGKIEDAVEAGLVDTILVKDLSRLGRHRTQTAIFIDYLSENNVNVISVTEGINSADENDDLIIGFKQIVNDLYAKDISKKVRTGIRQKQKNKGLVETLPLGYYKDRNLNKVLIDEVGAEIVREVFNLYVQGYGLTTIAKMMNTKGIKSPEYYQRRRIADWRPEISKRYLWAQTSVKRILTNELYIGVMVNHKTVTNKIKKTKTIIPPEEQFRHESFCEPIIEKSVWDQAQFLLSQRAVIHPRSKKGNKLHRYAGIIKCADCGASLIAKKRKLKGNEYIEYTCNSHHRYGKEYCTPHTVREKQLDELVVDEIRQLHEYILSESDKYDKIVRDWNQKKPLYDKQIENHEKSINGLNRQIEELIIERISDREHADIYNRMIAERESQIQEHQKKIDECREYDKISKEKHKNYHKASQVIQGIIDEGIITDTNLRMLVHQVRIHQNEDNSLDIRFKMNGNWNGGVAVYVEPDTDDQII
jgi:DNA invertase Pin-like site-specific DNA recombinase